jgi:tRNA (guanine-N7-)-methyltransferase
MENFIRTYGRLRCRGIKTDIIENNVNLHKEIKKEIFKENNTLEIGFGNGEVLIHRSLNSPNKNHIGVDVYENGIVKVLKIIEEKKIKNLNICQMDVRVFILYMEKLNEKIYFQEVYILFPDPWHKKSEKKREKKRLVNKNLLENIKKILDINGKLFFATDHIDYFENVKNTLIELNFFIEKTTVNTYVNEDFILSNYEKKAVNDRHYLLAIKK